MRFFVENSVFGYHDVSDNISNKFSNNIKRKSKNISFFEEITPFSVFKRFHYS